MSFTTQRRAQVTNNTNPFRDAVDTLLSEQATPEGRALKAKLIENLRLGVHTGVPRESYALADQLDEARRVQRRPIFLRYGWDIVPIWHWKDHPEYVQDSPFDGTVFSLTDDDPGDRQLSLEIMRSPVTEAELSATLGRLPESFSGQHNLAMVYAEPIWDVGLMPQNWGRLAKVLKDTPGCRGIFFDNEVYGADPVWEWSAIPGATDRRKASQTLFDCGKACAEAVATEWPTAIVKMIFGPWVANPNLVTIIDGRLPYTDWTNNLSVYDAFFYGFVQGSKGTWLQVLDGGEIYGAQTREQFRAVKEIQRAHSEAIPAVTLYDHPDTPGQPGMWADIRAGRSKEWLARQCANALAEYDYVTLYTEEHRWFEAWNWPPTVQPTDWVEAIRAVAPKTTSPTPSF